MILTGAQSMKAKSLNIVFIYCQRLEAKFRTVSKMQMRQMLATLRFCVIHFLQQTTPPS